MARAKRAPVHRTKSPWVNAILAVLCITGPSWRWPLLGLFLLWHCLLTSIMARARRAWDDRAKSPWVNGSMLSWQCCALLGHLGGDPYWDSFSVALLTNQYNGKGQKGLGLQGQKPLRQCVTAILAELFITEPSWWGQKGLGSQGQKPLGQCYLGGAVHYWAILAVAPTGILSVVALLSNNYDGKGQKGTRS